MNSSGEPNIPSCLIKVHDGEEGSFRKPEVPDVDLSR